MKDLPLRVIISYVLDYVIVIAFAIGFALMDKIGPFRQHFSLQNYTLQYPYAEHERVPISNAFIYVVIAPLAIIILWTMLIDGLFSHHKSSSYSLSQRKHQHGFGWMGHSLRDRLWELNCGVLGLLLAVSGALVVTQALKNAAGKPRPDLIARCKPNVFEDVPVFGLSNSSICTETSQAIMWDGFRSWPSGHSSTSFAGLGYLAFYMSGKLHVFDTRGEVWKTILVLVPILGASLIAVSRIMDARHHPFDVISGSLFGLLFGWGAYRQYFPPLSETWKKGRAYPIRSWGRDPIETKIQENRAGGSTNHELADMVSAKDAHYNDPRAEYTSAIGGEGDFEAGGHHGNHMADRDSYEMNRRLAGATKA